MLVSMSHKPPPELGRTYESDCSAQPQRRKYNKLSYR